MLYGKKGADIVVLASHDTWITDAGNSEKAPILNDKVVDAIFTGHQHVNNKQVINGIPVLQARAYGRDVQHVQFAFHKDSKDLKINDSEIIENIANLELSEDETTKDILIIFIKNITLQRLKMKF